MQSFHDPKKIHKFKVHVELTFVEKSKKKGLLWSVIMLNRSYKKKR